jgi:uncharacterized membrane protein
VIRWDYLEHEEVGMRDSEALFVLAAPYDDVAAASADLTALEALYAEAQTSRALDAVVVERDAYGQVLLVERTYTDKAPEPGLAIGVASTLFPPIGVGAALTVPGGGAAVGAIVRHLHADIPREELEQLAEMLEAAEAGLVVVYDESVAQKVEATVSSDSHTIIRASDVDPHQVVRDAGPLSDPVITKK